VEHSLETLKNCPSCNSSELNDKLSCIDYTYSKDMFSIQCCSACGLLFTNPRPDEEAIGPYYDNPEYVSHTDTSKGLLFKLYSIVKSYSLKQKRKLLTGLTKQRTVLDYGAGTGDFSIELSNNGWAVSAYEPEPSAAARITEKTAEINLLNSLSDLGKNSVSVVTLWHVLEHVHRLEETLSHFNRVLQSSGHLIIAVPNHTSYDAEFYNGNWAAYDVPRHLYHFNPATLTPLIEKHGYILQEIKPMWFDSFYVSLLSEQISGTTGFLKSMFGWSRAFLIGLLSNVFALLDTKKCSSVIYIFKKVV